MNKEDRVKELIACCRMKDGRRFCSFSIIHDGVKYYASVMLAKSILESL